MISVLVAASPVHLQALVSLARTRRPPCFLYCITLTLTWKPRLAWSAENEPRSIYIGEETHTHTETHTQTLRHIHHGVFMLCRLFVFVTAAAGSATPCCQTRACSAGTPWRFWTPCDLQGISLMYETNWHSRPLSRDISA